MLTRSERKLNDIYYLLKESDNDDSLENKDNRDTDTCDSDANAEE